MLKENAIKAIVFGQPGVPARLIAAMLAAVMMLAGVLAGYQHAGAAAQAALYVAPNGSGSACTLIVPCSLTAARDYVRTINGAMSGDIIVYLRGGLYTLSTPFDLRETASIHDSGTNGFAIVYRAYPGERPVISGGRAITGWTLYDGSNNISRAFVGVGVQTRQLYVNGLRAIRARGNPAAFTKTATGFLANNSTMQAWGNPTDIEIVSRNAWRHIRCGVAAISGASITIKNPCWKNISVSPNPGPPFNGHGGPGLDSPSWVENAYELLDSPREWYLDRSSGYLYYKPGHHEDLATANVVIPVVERLIDASGESATRKIHDLRFLGINFEYATWLRPSGDEGYADNQAGILWAGSSTPPAPAKTGGNLSFQYAERIVLERNTLTHLGGTAIDFGNGSQHNTIIGNAIYDLSSSGIQLGEVLDYAVTDPKSMTDGNLIKDNFIFSPGQEYEDSVGIWVGYARNTLIDHNEVAHTPYTGISVGWGWGANTYAENNKITNNFVHGVLRVLRDGGAIYTLSEQGGLGVGSEIRGNFLTYSLATNGGQGIYLDEGSAYFDVYSNVVTHISNNWYNMWINTIHDNKIHDNYADSNRVLNNCTNCLVVNNITDITDEIMPQTARDIVGNAGIEAAYTDIVPSLVYNNDYDRIIYHGQWFTSSARGLGDYFDDVRYTKTDGDSFEFRFNGTGVDYIAEKNSDQGNVDIYLDGLFQKTVNTSSATRQTQQVIYSTACLSAGPHTLKGIKRSGQFLLVDGLSVRRPKPSAAGLPSAVGAVLAPQLSAHVYLPFVCQ